MTSGARVAPRGHQSPHGAKEHREPHREGDPHHRRGLGDLDKLHLVPDAALERDDAAELSRAGVQGEGEAMSRIVPHDQWRGDVGEAARETIAFGAGVSRDQALML